MVKTTIIIEDDLYKALVKEALERYGTTRKLSKLINEKLGAKATPKRRAKEALRVKLGRALPPEEIERLAEEGWDEVLGWRP